MADDSGFSIRFVRHYNISTDQVPTLREVEPLRLRIRPRWKRVLFAPRFALICRRTGMSWRGVCALTWLTIKYTPHG